jgi:catechol 2,3-dioxygenase-like lactoylglutathione lyase family enzyme
MTTGKSPGTICGIHHVCVRVDDIEQAIAWYGEKLDFSVKRRSVVEQLPGVEVAFLTDQCGAHLEIIGSGERRRHAVGQNFGEQLAQRGWNHICFSTDNVDAIMADLASRGVPAVLPANDYPEGPARTALVQDLEGNLIEFYGPMNGPIDVR